jgi:hypothetical protein
MKLKASLLLSILLFGFTVAVAQLYSSENELGAGAFAYENSNAIKSLF